MITNSARVPLPTAATISSNNTGWDMFKVQYCVLLKIVKLLMSSLRPKAAFLLNYAAEWAALGFLQALAGLSGDLGELRGPALELGELVGVRA